MTFNDQYDGKVNHQAICAETHKFCKKDLYISGKNFMGRSKLKDMKRAG